MERNLLIIIVFAILILSAMIAKYKIKKNKEKYLVMSGLYFNNNARHCFKNPYDDERFPGYCTTINNVIV